MEAFTADVPRDLFQSLSFFLYVELNKESFISEIDLRLKGEKKLKTSDYTYKSMAR